MYRPSLTTVLSVLFLGYMANSMWNIVQLYLPPPPCPAGNYSVHLYLSPQGYVILAWYLQGTRPASPTW